MRRRSQLAVAASAALLLLSGCGAGSSVAGLHPPPPEVTTKAPITADSAQQIAERVIADARTAEAAGRGGNAADLRSKALTGVELTMAEAAARTTSRTVPTTAPVAAVPATRVLGISRGRSWPRVIFVSSTDTSGNQVLQLLTSPDATSPFKLASSVPMEPGTSVAALDEPAEGSPVVTDGAGLPVSPATVLKEYAGGLAFPKPGTATHVDTTDRFASLVRTNAANQAKAFGKLAALQQVQTPLPQDTVALRLRNGGAVVFGLLERVDTITLRSGGQALTPPAEVQALLHQKKLTKSAEKRTLESVVFTVPPSGRATLVGVEEQLSSVKGS